MDKNKDKYVLVEWPETQYFMDHPRWSECLLIATIDTHPCSDGAYAVPEDIYNEIVDGLNKNLSDE